MMKAVLDNKAEVIVTGHSNQAETAMLQNMLDHFVLNHQYVLQITSCKSSCLHHMIYHHHENGGYCGCNQSLVH